VPLPLLTSWIHSVASVNPITPIVEAQRSLIAGSWDDVGIAAIVGAAMVAFFLVWAVTGMKRAESAGG